MLIIEKRNNYKILINSLWAVFCGIGTVISIFITFFAIFNLKRSNIGGSLIGIVVFLFGTLLLCNMVYQFVTEIISENFRIELDDEHYIFKSICIKFLIKYKDIEEIYTVRRHYSRRRRIELLKIRVKSGKRLYISFEVLDKKEEKEIRKIFKEKVGRKVMDKFQIWE